MRAVLLPACFAALISLKEAPALLIHLWTASSALPWQPVNSEHLTPSSIVINSLFTDGGQGAGDTHCCSTALVCAEENLKMTGKVQSPVRAQTLAPFSRGEQYDTNGGSVLQCSCRNNNNVSLIRGPDHNNTTTDTHRLRSIHHTSYTSVNNQHPQST